MHEFVDEAHGAGTGRRRAGRSAAIAVAAVIVVVAAACAGAPEPVESDQITATTRPAVVATTTTVADGSPTTVTPTTVPPATVPSPTTPDTTVTSPEPVPISFRAASTVARTAGCEVFPPDHFLNANGVDTLAVHPESQKWIDYLGGAGEPVRWPSGKISNGVRGGIPLNVVDSRQVKGAPVHLNLNWTNKGWHGWYPIPENPMLEGYPSVQWDRHMLLLDVAECMAYELIGYEPLMFQLFGVHTALSGTRYPLNSTEKPAITTNAADTPMIGQYLRVDEVESGNIGHAVGFCTSSIGNRAIWPAQRGDGKDPSPDAIPMGAWLRLRGDVDLSAFSGQARPIVEALREHGMFLTDICGHKLNVMAENSGGWNDAELKQLQHLTPAHFEVVDSTPMMIDDTTFAIR